MKNIQYSVDGKDINSFCLNEEFGDGGRGIRWNKETSKWDVYEYRMSQEENVVDSLCDFKDALILMTRLI